MPPSRRVRPRRRHGSRGARGRGTKPVEAKWREALQRWGWVGNDDEPSANRGDEVSADVKAADVKALRERTGAGMMDARPPSPRRAATWTRRSTCCESRGRRRPRSAADRPPARASSSYIHATGKVGVLVEVGCETDFVARTDEVREFAREVAVHIAGAAPPPQYVSKDEIPAGVREAERQVGSGRARMASRTTSSTRSSAASSPSGRPSVALLDQEHINSDRYDGKTIEELRTEIASKTGRTSPSPASPGSRSGRGVVATRHSGGAPEVVRRGVDGRPRVRDGSRSSGADRGPDSGGVGAGRRDRCRRRGRKHLSRPRRRGRGDGPGDRRLHGDAGHGAQRARSRTRSRSSAPTPGCCRRSPSPRSPSRTSAAAPSATSRRAAS